MAKMYRPDSYGIMRPVDSKALDKVNHIHKLKKESGSKPWPVVSAILKLWQETNPEEYDSYIVEVKNLQKTRGDKFGRGRKDKDSNLRYTVDIPEFVIRALRMIYSADELVMDKEFFIEFAKRYPAFKVAEKI